MITSLCLDLYFDTSLYQLEYILKYFFQDGNRPLHILNFYISEIVFLLRSHLNDSLTKLKKKYMSHDCVPQNSVALYIRAS